MDSKSSFSDVLKDVAENIYGHKRKLDFVLHRIEEWRNRNDGDPRILDVGCGTGQVITTHIARCGYEVLGIDLDGPSIDIARSEHNSPNLRFACIPVDEIQEKFDVILLTEVLEHLREPEKLLADVSDRLSPGGIILITVPNGYGPFELEKLLWRFFRMDRLWTDGLLLGLKKMKRALGGAVRLQPVIAENSLDESPHVQFFTRSKMNRLLQSVNLKMTSFGKSSFVAGPFSNTLLPKSRFLYDLNSSLGSILPAFMVNGFYFEAEKHGVGS